jgi:hypothetical protein
LWQARDGYVVVAARFRQVAGLRLIVNKEIGQVLAGVADPSLAAVA